MITNRIDSFSGNKKIHFPVFLIAILFLSGLMTLFYDVRLDPGDDFYFHISRFKALIQSFEDGTFPTYIDYQAVYGYGYLVQTFYSDFILIPFALIGNLFGYMFAYKALLFTMTVLCGIFMYKFIYKLKSDFYAASIGSLIYTFSLYRMYDMYARAALGEVFSFTFLPLVFLGIYYIIYGDYKKWYILTIGFSLIIFSHAISSVFIALALIIVCAFYYKSFINEPKRFYYLLLSAGVSIILVSYYLLPFLEQLASDKFFFQKYSALPNWVNGMKMSVTEAMISMTDGLHFRMGAGPKLGLLLILPLIARIFIKRTNDNKTLLRLLDFFLILGIFYTILITEIAPWNRFPLSLLSIIQFPFRLLEFVTFFFAVAGGIYITLAFKKNVYKSAVLLLLFVSTTIVIWQSVNVYVERSHQTGRLSEEGRYKDEFEHLFFWGKEYFPVKLAEFDSIQKVITERGDTIISKTGETDVTVFTRNKNITEFYINTHRQDSLELPLIYYKGYTATLNEKVIPVTGNPNGLVQVAVDKSGRVEVYYAGTVVQRTGFITTIFSILALCLYISVRNRRSKKQKL